MRYRLRCTDGGLRGQELDVLAPFESVHAVVRELDPRRAGRLQGWRLYHDAFLLDQALGPEAFLAAQPGRLDLAPYQLVPVLRALRMSRPRLLLADGVGLGKTIQAGLVLSELIARRRAHRILIVAPAGPLLEQWDGELRTRFGLRFQKVKRWDDLQEIRRSLELGSNPFDHLSFCLTSYTFARQEKVLADLERSTWDVVVIDEAHHAFRMGTAGEREDKITRKLAEVLAKRTDGLLLLTATPHDGYDPHFASLVELLDPSLVDGRGSLRGDAYRRYVIRRLKRHIVDPRTGEPLFRERRVYPKPVALVPGRHARVAELQRGLVELVVPRLRSAVRRRRYEDVLAFVALLKRSVSTLRAAESTLRAIAGRYEELLRRGHEDQEIRRERLRTMRDYRRQLARFGALSQEEEEDQARLEAEDVASELFHDSEELEESLDSSRREARREGDRLRRAAAVGAELSRLAELAESAQSVDPKLEALVRELADLRASEPRANVLLYTEYTDSQDAAAESIRAAIESGALEGEVLTIRGEDDERSRTQATARFTKEDGLVLVSTDATAEGLNLHARCHHLLHLELPYNPNRLEQRNGRIDRYGQGREPEVRYLYLSGSFEERLLLRLVAKVERQRARLSFVPDTLGGVVGGDAGIAGLLEGLVRDEDSLFGAPAAPLELAAAEEDDPASEAFRELQAEIDRALSGFERTARTATWLGEAGLGAEESLVAEADSARARGERLAHVDLAPFVRGSVEADGGRAYDASDGSLVLSLPPSWTFGLEDLPGYDAEARCLRLTTDPARIADEAGRPLGYLGRAHPVVRRALDRVQSLQHGTGDSPLDRRVSAARAQGDRPALLFTYLARVRSEAGRELERVLAVLVPAGGEPRVLTDPAEWQALAGEAVPTAGVWERHFAADGLAQEPESARAARDAFEPIAREHLEQHARRLDRERLDLSDWLDRRARDLCGQVVSAQATLFADDDGEPAVERWRHLQEPAERLAALAVDKAAAVARRREADGVLRLHAARLADLELRSRTTVEAPSPLGLLMLVPAAGEG